MADAATMAGSAPASDIGSDALIRFQARIAVAALVAFAAAGIHAAIEWRSLAADGFYYLLRMLEKESFEIAWVPQREAMEVLHELPILAAMRLGIRDVETLALVYGLTVQLAPLLLVALCYPLLPRAQKLLFLFPLLHYLACTTGAAFVAIHAGPTAAAYFWLLLYLVLFARPRPAWLALVVLMALPVPKLHEGMLFLAPVLCFAALGRTLRARTLGERVVFAAIALWFVAAAAYQIGGIVAPADTVNRDGFIRGLLEMRWIAVQGLVNVPMMLGTLGLLLIAGFAAFGPRADGARRPERIMIASFGATAAVALVTVIALDVAVAPRAQFAARNNAVVASLPLALAVLWALRRPGWLSPPRLRVSLGICAVLAATALLYDLHVTQRWSAYLADYRSLLRQQRGFVTWERALASLPPARRRAMDALTWAWISPTMSIVLAPGGAVGAIVANSPANDGGWQPFDARDPKQLPRSRFWDLAPYLRALAEQKAAGDVR